MKCIDCNGTGVNAEHPGRDCSLCRGTGKLCDVCGRAATDACLHADVCSDCQGDMREHGMNPHEVVP